MAKDRYAMTKTNRKLKDKMLNVKLPSEDYLELKRIANDLGHLSLSGMIRIIIYSGLDRVKKTGNSKAFLDIGKK